MLNSSQLLPIFRCNSRCSEDSFIALCSNKSPLYIMAFLCTVQDFGFLERAVEVFVLVGYGTASLGIC